VTERGLELKVLDRYILREFFKILLFAIIGATLLSILVDVIEKIDTFIDKESTFFDVLLYYVYHTPYTATLTLPAAMLIATIFTLGQCNRWNELVAMKASGISLYRTLTPLLIASFMISVMTLIVGETVLPHSNDRKRLIYDHQILKKPEKRMEAETLRYQGKRGVLYSIDRYDPRTGRMDDITLVKKDTGGRLVYRIDASRGEWQDDRWVLRNGYLRYFTASREETTFRFATLTSRDLEERPEDFAKPPKNPEDMNYIELSHHIDRQKRGGGATLEDEVYLRLKLAFPFANLIIVLFGAPLATISRKGGAAANFGVSLFIFILFWGFIHTSRALGESGAVNPFIAAWMANLAFGSAGVVILFKVRK
jgi:lipopolysaccharide export system permease protein